MWPTLNTWVPSAARPVTAPRCRDSVKPERTTSATTGFTPWCSVKIVMPAVCPFPARLSAAPLRVPCRAMRAVVQRVSRASVTVDGQVVGAIEEPGLLVLVGVTHGDTPEQAARLAAKLWGLRILDGEKSCSDVAAPLLVISQFTLYADLAKGRRPSWSAAAPGPVAEPLVDAVVQALRDLGARVETGVFGADMKVALVNDGPVTIVLDLCRPLGYTPRRWDRRRDLRGPGRPARTAAGPAARPGPSTGTRSGRTTVPATRSSAGWPPGGTRHGDVHAAVRRTTVRVVRQHAPGGQAAEDDDQHHGGDREDPLLPRREVPRPGVGLGVHGCPV